MKIITSILLVSLLFTAGKAGAQKATINIVATSYRGHVSIFDPAVNYDPKKFLSIINLDKNGAAAYTAGLSIPRYVVLYFNLPGFLSFSYALYLSPGDDLLFNIKFANNVPAVNVSGKGGNNNQPEIFALTNINLQRFKEDKLPYRAIAAIKTQEALNDLILKKYIMQYKPSAAFVKNARLNCRYFAPSAYYEIYHNKLRYPKTNPDDKKWQKIEDSLLAKHPINNDNALTSFNYEHLTDIFMIQEPPVFMYEATTRHPGNFYRDWYQTKVDKGNKMYASESRNLFIERVINKFFSGKTAELAYAQMLRFHLRFNHYEDIDLVFKHFKQKYPRNSYIPAFSAAMAEIAAKKTQTLNNKMVFVANDGTTLNTLEDVMRLMKGKNVFVDMWGTWCSPCRSELEKYAPEIRDHFKGKNISFLYIANKDINHKEEWRKVIAYYKIEGIHILANDNLDKDIMSKLKSTGYPTHFIIKKDGSFKKIKTQDGSQTQQVIKEIETEL